MRGNDRVREKQADDMRLVKVEVIHRQYAALLCLTQNVGQRLHAEAVVVGDEPLRLPQGKAGEGVGLRGVGKAEFIFAVFIFADEKIVEDVFQFFFRAVKDEVRIAERIFKPVGGEAGPATRRSSRVCGFRSIPDGDGRRSESRPHERTRASRCRAALPQQLALSRA